MSETKLGSYGNLQLRWVDESSNQKYLKNKHIRFLCRKYKDLTHFGQSCKSCTILIYYSRFVLEEDLWTSIDTRS